MVSFWNAITRKKKFSDDVHESKLARVLTLFDLTALGVGSTLGLGVYVLAGSVAYNIAGPAVTISFLIAAIASTFSGLCYAEFAARVPKAGSAYVYSYVTIGELIAFIIGWNMLIEYAIGTSSVAAGMSGYIDELFGKEISKALRSVMPMNSEFLASYPDFFSVGLILIVTALLAFGVKESSTVNNVFTTINMLTILTVLVAGVWNSDPNNWKITPESIPDEYKARAGVGGFMPFGIAGIMAGAAKCFYGFVGFDCVATTGEEAKKPERNIPLSIIISLIIIFVAYFSISTVLTMMWPYYLQNPDAPFIHVFHELGWIKVKWVVTIGALFALANSLFGSTFPIPRVVYSMANDGLIFKSLASVNKKTKTPVFATILCGLLASLMALFFNLEQLIDMMSIGTLLAYTIVAISVLILRYRDERVVLPELELSNYQIIRQLMNLNMTKRPNSLTSRITVILITIFCFIGVLFCGCIQYFESYGTLEILALIILTAGLVLCILIIIRQPVSDEKITFKVPFVPILPCFSILMNMVLMFQLDPHTWIRLGVWLIFGFLVYFLYGIKNSTAANQIAILPQMNGSNSKNNNNNNHNAKETEVYFENSRL